MPLLKAPTETTCLKTRLVGVAIEAGITKKLNDVIPTLGTPTLAGPLQDEGPLTWKYLPKFDVIWVPFKTGDANPRVTQAWKADKASVRFESSSSIKLPVLVE